MADRDVERVSGRAIPSLALPYRTVQVMVSGAIIACTARTAPVLQELVLKGSGRGTARLGGEQPAFMRRAVAAIMQKLRSGVPCSWFSVLWG
jgi:hypothetical protein